MGKKILVIDDEPSIRQVLEIHLNSAGYSVVCASSAGEGLRLAANGGIDAVICDFSLPDMQGIDVVRAVKSKNAGIPVVIISGFIEDELLEKAKDYGASGYLKKPFLKETLLSVISEALCANGEPSRP